MRFVLASASPARLATLRRAGVEPDVMVSGVDEDAITADSVADLALALALAKAAAVAGQIAGSALVLGCDSLLDLDGVALGKPGDVATAYERWRQLRGRSAALVTGHALLRVRDGAVDDRAARTASTTVHFGFPDDGEIEAYVATGEPLAVAGAFTIDGLGGWFVDGIEGDHHNVVGLSLPLMRGLLGELGLGLADVGYGGSR
ncbi:MAG: nucleoside triphosphate pyrophosphatase [bacterium]